MDCLVKRNKNGVVVKNADGKKVLTLEKTSAGYKCCAAFAGGSCLAWVYPTKEEAIRRSFNYLEGLYFPGVTLNGQKSINPFFEALA